MFLQWNFKNTKIKRDKHSNNMKNKVLKLIIKQKIECTSNSMGQQSHASNIEEEMYKRPIDITKIRKIKYMQGTT